MTKISGLLCGSKLASISSLLGNTLETVEISGLPSQGIGILLNLIVKFIIKMVYTVATFALNLVDLMQMVVNKIIGLDGEFVVIDTQSPMMKFLLNDTVWKVFTYMCGLAIVLLIVFTIYAIIRSEFKFAAGDADHNNKSRIFGRSLRSVFSLMMFPMVLFASIFLLNSILYGFDRVFKSASGEGIVSLGGQTFTASAYGANKYRNYASLGVRVPILIDFDDPVQNGTAAGYSGEELAKIYDTYNKLSGAALYEKFSNRDFDKFNDTIIYKNNKLYNTKLFEEFETFAVTPEQYYVMADFTDFAVKSGLTYTYKSVKDEDISWKYVDSAVFDKQSYTLTIKYRDTDGLVTGNAGETYTAQITPSSTNISTPIQDAMRTIASMLATGEYSDKSFKVMDRNEDFINFIEWDTRKVKIKLSDDCNLSDPKTWTVADGVIIYEWQRYEYNNTIDHNMSSNELKEKGIYLSAATLKKRSYNSIISKYVTTDEIDVVVINNNYYRIVEATDPKDVDESGYRSYRILGYDTKLGDSALYTNMRNHIIQTTDYVSDGYINSSTKQTVAASTISGYTYKGRAYYIVTNEFHRTDKSEDGAINYKYYGNNRVRRLQKGVLNETTGQLERTGEYFFVDTPISVSGDEVAEVKTSSGTYYYYLPDVIDNTITKVDKGYYKYSYLGFVSNALANEVITIAGKTYVCPEGCLDDIKEVKNVGTVETIDYDTGETKYQFYDDRVSKIIKKVSWPEKLASDLQTIYKDINIGLLITNGTWLTKLSELSKNYLNSTGLGGDVETAFSSLLIHPLGIILSELFLGVIEDANPYYNYGTYLFSSAYDEETIRGLMLALLGESKYFQLKQQMTYFIEIYNAYFATMLDEIAYTENFDLTDGENASVQLYTYKAYLASILLSDDCADFFKNLALGVVGASDFEYNYLRTGSGEKYNDYASDKFFRGESLTKYAEAMLNNYKNATTNEIFLSFLNYISYNDEKVNGNPYREIYNKRKSIILDAVTSTENMATKVGALKNLKERLNYVTKPTDANFKNIDNIGVLDNIIKEFVKTAQEDENFDNLYDIIIDTNGNVTVNNNFNITALDFSSKLSDLNTLSNWIDVKNYSTILKEYASLATRVKNSDIYSSKSSEERRKYDSALKELQNKYQKIADYVDVQSQYDSLTKYYISYAMKIYLDDQVTNTGFSVVIRNKSYTIGESFTRAKLAEYILGGEYLSKIGYTPAFVDKDYKGMITIEGNKLTGSWTYLKEFLTQFGTICMDVYSSTNYAALMTKTIDELKLDGNNIELVNLVNTFIESQPGMPTVQARVGTLTSTEKMQALLEYILLQNGTEKVNYIGKTLKDIRLECINFLMNYEKPSGISEQEAENSYMAVFYLANANWKADGNVGGKNWIKNSYDKNQTDPGTLINNGKYHIYALETNTQSVGTVLRLAGIDSRPTEDIIGLEYSIDFNYHGVDEQYGDVFILCTYNPTSKLYLPVMSTNRLNTNSRIKKSLKDATDDYGNKLFIDSDGEFSDNDDKYLTYMHSDYISTESMSGTATSYQNCYPIIARGIIDSNGFPTAIRRVNGNIEFYRENTYFVNTSELGISEYFISVDAVTSGGNPFSSLTNIISKLFTGKSLASNMMSSIPRLKVDSYVGFAIGVQDVSVDIVDEGQCHLDYTFKSYQTDTIQMDLLYDIDEMNIIIYLAGAFILLGMIWRAFWGVISRMYTVTLYFVMGPVMIATIAQKDEKVEKKKVKEMNSAYDSWRESLVAELLGIFGYVFAINLYFILATMVEGFTMFTTADAFSGLPVFSNITVAALNEITRLVFTIGLASLFSQIPKMFSGILSINVDIFDKGAGTIGQVKNSINEVQDFVSGQKFLDTVGTMKDNSVFFQAKKSVEKIGRNIAIKAAEKAAEANGVPKDAAKKAAKALKQQMEEVEQKRIVERQTRQYNRDKRYDSMFGYDEDLGGKAEKLRDKMYPYADKGQDKKGKDKGKKKK